MKKGKKIDRIKILYIVFFVLLFGELVAASVGLFSASVETRIASWNNVFLIAITTIALVIPWAIEVKYKVDIPDVLEFVVMIMIFIAVVLGFLHDYYVHVPGFDKLTHTLSGVVLALLAFNMITFLNRYEKVSLTMGAGMTSFVSFMFSMTLLVIWEFYEFVVDTINYNIDPFTTSNMQRYQWVNPPEMFPQDYGLYDTMIDLWVGAIGALLVALVGYYIIRNNPIYKRKLMK